MDQEQQPQTSTPAATDTDKALDPTPAAASGAGPSRDPAHHGLTKAVHHMSKAAASGPLVKQAAGDVVPVATSAPAPVPVAASFAPADPVLLADPVLNAAPAPAQPASVPQRPLRGVLIGGTAAVAIIVALFGWWSFGSGGHGGIAPSSVPAVGPAKTVATPAPVTAPVTASASAAQPDPSSPAGPPPDSAKVDGVGGADATHASATEADPDAPQSARPAVPETTSLPTDHAPTFDMLRAGNDGTLTVAGRADAGSSVEILLDGKVIDTVLAASDGKFASVVLGDASVVPRALTLRATGPDGQVHRSDESLTVAPSARAVEDAAKAAGDDPAQVQAQGAQAAALAALPVLTDANGNVRVLAGVSSELVIDTLTFGDGRQVDISGRGAPAGTILRAYLDDAEAGLVQPTANNGSWRMILPAPAAGKHALRIDAMDATGKVVARAETPFVAAAPSALQAAAGGTGGAAPGTGGGSDGNLANGSKAITIAKGYTLWAIAREAYGDPYLYVRVFEANKDQIRDPDKIYPGQVLTLP